LTNHSTAQAAAVIPGPSSDQIDSPQTSKTLNESFYYHFYQQAVGGRPPRYAPAPLLPPWVPKRLLPPTAEQTAT